MGSTSKIEQHIFPKTLLHVLSSLQHVGADAYIVGGAIRDILLERNVIDYDIATSSSPNEINMIFSGSELNQGSFGNTTLSYEEHRFEITTFRQESDYEDHRHPNRVQFVTSYEDDWRRRDFTLNAMAFDPISKELLDPANGLSDLDSKLIRTIGDPITRFEEDALRMLRAIRLAAECRLYIEHSTLSAITPERFERANISDQQIDHELTRLWKSTEPDIGIFYLNKTKLLQKTHPSLSSVSFDKMASIKSIENWRERRNHVMLTTL